MQTLLEHGIWVPLEGVVNQVLASAPDTQDSLSQYEGTQIRICIKPKLEVDVLILKQGLRLGKFPQSQPQTEIHAYGHDFLTLLTAKKSQEQLESSRFELSGDNQLALELGAVVDALDVDWIRLLQPYTGTFMAQQFSAGLSQLKHLNMSHALPEIIKDFLQQENPQLVSEKQMQAFNLQVKKLDEQTQALSQRIALLSKPSTKIGGASKNG